jgi:hypothetical protein
MAGNFTALPDFGAPLNLHKRPDFGSIADFAAIQIDEGKNFDIAAQLHVSRYSLEVIHFEGSIMYKLPPLVV